MAMSNEKASMNEGCCRKLAGAGPLVRLGKNDGLAASGSDLSFASGVFTSSRRPVRRTLPLASAHSV